MEFFQAKSPFLGVMCIPTVAIATKYPTSQQMTTLDIYKVNWLGIINNPADARLCLSLPPLHQAHNTCISSFNHHQSDTRSFEVSRRQSRDREILVDTYM